MKQVLNPRLKMYHELLTKYDIIDKEFPVKNSLFAKLKTITISYSIDTLDTVSMSTLLNREFLIYQRINLNFNNNKKFKTTRFLVTLRNLSLYLCLELFIHSYFFAKSNLGHKRQNSFMFTFNEKFYNSFLPTEILSKLESYKGSNQNELVSLFFQHIQCTKVQNQLNYYFVSHFTK